MKILPIITVFLLVSKTLYAQETLPVPSSIKAAYQKETRELSGQPGPKYWQNTPDYNLKIDFNLATREIKGIVDVTYFNHSPDTLREIWFNLYPNLYKKGVERNSKIKDADLGKGVAISAMKISGKPKSVNSLKKLPEIIPPGIPDIFIPLYAVKSGNLEVPIILRYYASGIKPNEPDKSNIGSGWTLDIGGLVTRTVEGKADEQFAKPYPMKTPNQINQEVESDGYDLDNSDPSGHIPFKQ